MKIEINPEQDITSKNWLNYIIWRCDAGVAVYPG